MIPFNLILQLDILLKKLNFDLLTTRVMGWGVGGEVCRQNSCDHIATICDSNIFDMHHIF